jgi:hypothetical protein
MLEALNLSCKRVMLEALSFNCDRGMLGGSTHFRFLTGVNDTAYFFLKVDSSKTQVAGLVKAV